MARRPAFKLVLLSTALFFALFFALGLPQPATASEQLNKARSLAGEGKIKSAIGLLDAAQKQATGKSRATLLNAQGWLTYKEGRSRQAAALYRAALREAEEANDTALARKIKNNMGINYFVGGDLDQAESLFRETAAEGSGLAKKYLGLIAEQKRSAEMNQYIRAGVKHRLLGEFDKAIPEYDKALAIDGENVQVLEYRGYAYFRLGDFTRAQADLERAHGIDPNRVNVTINLLKVHCKSGDDAAYQNFVTAEQERIQAQAKVFASDAELRRLCGGRLAALNLP